MPGVSWRRHLPLLAVLALGAGLALWGIAFGLPNVFTPDEPSVVGRALVMVRAADLNPHYFTYPHLIYLLQAAVFWAMDHAPPLWLPGPAGLPTLAGDGRYYLAGRVLSAAGAVGTLACTYGMGRALGGPMTGLVAALYLAGVPVSVQHAHYATVDGLSATATALAGFGALQALAGTDEAREAVRSTRLPSRERAPRGRSTTTGVPTRFPPLLALSSVAAGLAAGSKYNAALALLCPVLAWIALWRGTRQSGSIPRLLGGLIAVLGLATLTFLLTTPSLVFDWRDFRGGLVGVARHYGATGHPGAEGDANWRWYLAYLAGPGFGLPLLVLAGLGLGLTVRRGAAGAVAVLYTLAYYALLCAGHVHFERNLLPALPFLAVFAAIATCALASRVGRRGGRARALMLGAIVLVAAAPGVATSARQDIALTHTFTQTLAGQWLVTHLPPGSTVAEENWEAPPLPPHRYRVVRVPALGTYGPSWYRAHGITYLVADSWTDGAYERSATSYPVEAAHYAELRGCARPLVVLHGGGQSLHPGPDYTVLTLPHHGCSSHSG